MMTSPCPHLWMFKFVIVVLALLNLIQIVGNMQRRPFPSLRHVAYVLAWLIRIRK